MLCSIGIFDFLDLVGTPLGIGDSCIPIQRPGIDGTAVFKTGERCKPFTLRSEIDCYHPLHASVLYYNYRQIIGATVDMAWHGIPWTGELSRVIVLDIEQPEILRLIGGVGGLSWPSFGYLKCNWKLVLAELDPP